MSSSNFEGGGDDDVSPSEFIDGRSIRWGYLAAAFFGSAILTLWSGLTEFIVESGSAAGSLLGGLGGGVSVLLEELLGIPVDATDAAARELILWLDLLGPLAFPVGILISLVTIAVIRRGVGYVV